MHNRKNNRKKVRKRTIDKTNKQMILLKGKFEIKM